MPIEPPYIDNLVKLIEGQIASGELAPGQRLPSLTQLASEHGISYGAVRLAMERLKASKVIRSHPGKGFYVPNT
jgi:GntR family transcriptional regulator